MRDGALGAAAFAGAGIALIGVAGGAVASGLIAGHERIALGAIEVAGAAAAAFIALRSTSRSGLARALAMASVCVAGALVLTASVWVLDLALVRPLDPPDSIVAAGLFLLGTIVFGASLHRQRPRPNGAPAASPLGRVASTDREDEVVAGGK